jgi:hypothetical protein
MSPKRPGREGGQTTGHPGLQYEQLVVILRAADDLNGRGNTDLLAGILKGARESRLRNLGLESSPVFGAFEQVEIEQIHKRIALAVQSGYLETAANHPDRLVLTEAGRKIERETLVVELLDELNAILAGGEPYELSFLLELDRGVILPLLDQIEATGNADFIPLLEAWEPFENRKIRSRINQIITNLSA